MELKFNHQEEWVGEERRKRKGKGRGLGREREKGEEGKRRKAALSDREGPGSYTLC